MGKVDGNRYMFSSVTTERRWTEKGRERGKREGMTEHSHFTLSFHPI